MFKLFAFITYPHNWFKKCANEIYWRNEGAKVRRKAERELEKLKPPKYKS